MRNSVFLAVLPLMLTACTSAGALDGEGNPVSRSEADTCRPEPGQRFIGQRASREVGAAILAATDTTIMRWIQPGIVATADYRFGRVTVFYDEQMIIQTVSCG